MFLRSGLLDRVDRGQIRNATSDRGRQIEQQPAQHTAAERVSGTGGVDHLASGSRRNVGGFAIDDEVGALFAVGHDDELFLRGDIGHRKAGLALDHGEFVVVAHNAPGGVDSLTEIVRREDDDLKCRVEDEFTTRSPKLAKVQPHHFWIRWPNQAIAARNRRSPSDRSKPPGFPGRDRRKRFDCSSGRPS